MTTPQHPQRLPLKAQLRRALSLRQWPTKYTVIASLICGVVTVLNQTSFGFPTVWKTTLTDALALFAFLGIGPVLGPKFRTAIHLPAQVATAIGVVLMIGMLVTQVNVTMPYRAIIIGVIQVAGGLGFAPTWAPTVGVY